MLAFIVYLVVAAAIFVAGLLVGKKNPTLADAAAKVAEAAKADAQAAIDKAKGK